MCIENMGSTNNKYIANSVEKPKRGVTLPTAKFEEGTTKIEQSIKKVLAEQQKIGAKLRSLERETSQKLTHRSELMRKISRLRLALQEEQTQN
mmetsp:Transcript_4641/g.5249  ORF Transcript_4641/g.5249 Transcript_4641/m.5249 type:complete len:93 (-) Transcript_4641:41-319(-)